MLPVFRNSQIQRKVLKIIHTSKRYRQHEVASPFTLFESRGFVPTLSPAQVASILHMYQGSMAVKAIGESPVHGFETNQLPSNNPIEDRRAVGRLSQTGGLLFGVYDGHGGCACAQAVQERLFDYLAVALLPVDILEKYSRLMHTDTPLEILQKHRHNNDYINSEMGRMHAASLNKFVSETLSSEFNEEPVEPDWSFTTSIENAFKQLDTDISLEALPGTSSVNFEAVEVALSGACATVAHISGVHMHVANAGDCRAVLGQFEDGSWQAVPLSQDHNVENKAEVERIKKEHPMSESSAVIKNGRLLGQLAPLRAFGDVRYKWNLQDIQRLEQLGTYGPKISPMNYYTPPYLTASPDIKYHRLGPRDKFLVLASDGLWEQLPNDKVVQLV